LRSDPYTYWQVAKLLGVAHRGWRWTGSDRITFLDILSRATDPGGDLTWLRLLETPPARSDKGARAEAWTARRGPLSPDSEVASVLFDFFRAMKDLDDLKDQAILALVFFDFRPGEIAAVMKMHTTTVTRRIRGRLAFDREGNPIKGQYLGGLINRVTDLMNGLTQACRKKDHGQCPEPEECACSCHRPPSPEATGDG
jgi:hypothetical protein